MKNVLNIFFTIFVLSWFFVTVPTYAQTSDTRYCSKIDEVIAIIFGYKDCEDMKKKIGTVPKPTLVPDPSGVVPSVDPDELPDYDPNSLYNNENLTYEEDINGVARLCAANKTYYLAASSITQVPWEVLAGIHYREGGCRSTSSSVGGRPIGSVEPDVRHCTANSEQGKPIPIGGGCGFRNLLDSIIYTGNHLKAKNGDRTPSTFQELVGALSRYNGGGNSNCRGQGTPYQHCPPSFPGEDDLYPLNRFDARHTPMYLRYCADYTPCNPPRVYTGLGALTVASAINKLSL